MSNWVEEAFLVPCLVEDVLLREVVGVEPSSLELLYHAWGQLPDPWVLLLLHPYLVVAVACPTVHFLDPCLWRQQQHLRLPLLKGVVDLPQPN